MNDSKMNQKLTKQELADLIANLLANNDSSIVHTVWFKELKRQYEVAV